MMTPTIFGPCEQTATGILAAIIIALIHRRCASLADLQHNPVIRVYDEAGNVIETHEHAGDFKEP
jgi:hypothetical protein